MPALEFLLKMEILKVGTSSDLYDMEVPPTPAVSLNLDVLCFGAAIKHV